ncbi:hypothetical protein [Rhodanobacter lindaniclasticus]
MKLRSINKRLLWATFVSGLFSVSLHGCAWSSNEIYALATFFCIALVVSASIMGLAKKTSIALLATIFLPLFGSWMYSLLGLFSPGDFSVGPCVERSTWVAFSALYLLSSGTMLMSCQLWSSRLVTAAVITIFAISSVLFLRNQFG